jgi:hypothetical protein
MPNAETPRVPGLKTRNKLPSTTPGVVGLTVLLITIAHQAENFMGLPNPWDGIAFGALLGLSVGAVLNWVRDLVAWHAAETQL